MSNQFFTDINIKIIEKKKYEYFNKISDVEKIEELKRVCRLIYNLDLENILIPAKIKDLTFSREQMLCKLQNIEYNQLDNQRLIKYNFCQVDPLSNFFYADPAFFILKKNFDLLRSFKSSLMSEFYYGDIDSFENQIHLKNTYISFILDDNEKQYLHKDFLFLNTHGGCKDISSILPHFENLSEKIFIINKLL